MPEIEAKLEDYLVEQVKQLGGHCLKLGPLSSIGLPDRIVLLPGARVGFIELKRDGMTPRRNQLEWLERLRRLGFQARWTWSRAEVDVFLTKVRG